MFDQALGQSLLAESSVGRPGALDGVDAVLDQIQRQGSSFEDAVVIAESYVGVHGDNGKFLTELGFLYIKTDRYGDAEAVLRRAMDVNPVLDPRTQEGLGRALMELHRHEEAFPLLKAALDGGRTDIKMHTYLAEAACAVGEFELARSEFSQIQSSDIPSDSPFLWRAMSRLHDLEVVTEGFPADPATDGADRAVQIARKNPYFAIKYGMALGARSDGDTSALEALVRLFTKHNDVALASKAAAVINDLGFSYRGDIDSDNGWHQKRSDGDRFAKGIVEAHRISRLRKLDPRQAIQYGEEALERFGSHPNILASLASAHIDGARRGFGNMARAKELLLEANELEPNNRVILSTMAQVAIRERDWLRALDLLDLAHKVDPKNHIILKQLANLAECQGKWDTVVKFCAMALEAKPTDLNLRVELGQAYIKAGKADRAEAILIPLHNDFPNEAKVITLLGQAAAQLGNSSGARKRYRQALDANPHYVPALEGMARLCITAGRYREASNLVERAKRYSPARAAVWVVSGDLAKAMGDDDLAQKEYQKALRIDPNFYEARCALGLGADEVRSSGVASDEHSGT